MPFTVVTTTTIVHHGRPDNSIFKIYLEGGITIVGTDEYPNFPTCVPAIHPDFIPVAVQALRDKVREQLARREFDWLEQRGNEYPACDHRKLVRDYVKRYKLTAYLSGVTIGEELVARINNQSVNLGRVVGLEGSA